MNTHNLIANSIKEKIDSFYKLLFALGAALLFVASAIALGIEFERAKPAINGANTKRAAARDTYKRSAPGNRTKAFPTVRELMSPLEQLSTASVGERETGRRKNEPGADQPDEAIRFRRLQMQDENGYIAPDGLIKAREHMELMKAAQREQEKASGEVEAESLTRQSWSWLGPGNIGGRIRSIVIHPTNPNAMWVGSVGGGIWRTNDGGGSWSPVNDFMANLAVSTMIIDPTNPNVMYAGTGEGYWTALPTDGVNGDGLQGAGVFKSTDGGVTWNQLSRTNPNTILDPATFIPTDWFYVNRLAISTNGSTILAATWRGIWRSTDGGSTWTPANGPPGVTGVTNGPIYDIAFDPTNDQLAIAGGRGQAFFSTDGGKNFAFAGFNFSISDGGKPATNGRVELAYAPSNPSIVYASVNQNNGDVYRSADGGQTYSRVNTGNNFFLGATNQGWYDNIIWVNPQDPNFVIVGGIELWHGFYNSTTQNLPLVQISNDSIHTDHHMIVAHPGFNNASNRTVFFGNDGGIYKTDDISTVGFPVQGAGKWERLNNNLGITQFYGAAGNRASGVIIGGTQDNGTLRFTGNPQGWTSMAGADGGFCAADQTDPNYFYGEKQNLEVIRSTNGGLSSSSINAGIADSGNQSPANFIAPVVLDPNNPNTLLAGGVSLWRTNNAKVAGLVPLPQWTAIKAPLANPNPPPSNVPISAIAVSPATSSFILVGDNNGNIFETFGGTQDSPSWSNIGGRVPSRFVTSLTIDSTRATSWIYATFGGFSSDNVYRSTDLGQSWTPITGSGATALPSVPVRSLAIHPLFRDVLYVGTEVGIFTSANGGLSWKLPNDGPANVSVDQLFWMGQDLVAVTHGRGLYRTSGDVLPNYPPGVVLNTNDSGPFSLRQAIIDANSNPQITQITFAISGSGVQTINLASQLPSITKPVTIDGLSQGGPDYNGPPLIELNGAGAAPNSFGLDILAGASTVRGLAINRFPGHAIILETAGGNSVERCYIGTNAAGTAVLGNGGYGIFISGSPNNRIGLNTTLGLLTPNIISGNRVGILISGFNASNNSVSNNYIGTNPDGANLGNIFDGVYIDNAPNNRIGGTRTLSGGSVIGTGNIISGNGVNSFDADGIEIVGKLANGNKIEANYIGLAPDGRTALRNLGSGVLINNAPGNVIGGTNVEARNVISGNRNLGGISLAGPDSFGTVIINNYVGTNAAGTVAVPNNANDIFVESRDNFIGLPGAGNLLAGFDNSFGNCIFLFDSGASGNTIQGNFIGTDKTGRLGLSSKGIGIQTLRNSRNLIGGTTPDRRNVISGNFHGVVLGTSDNLDAGENAVSGNYIGTDPTGTLPNGNVGDGLEILGTSGNKIGGTLSGWGNLISGNGGYGINVLGGFPAAKNNLIQGNFIGTNADGTGTLAGTLGNGNGIKIAPSAEGVNNIIGGSTAGARNLISGNLGFGVHVAGGSGTVVQGNYIGTDITGTANLGNGQGNATSGVQLEAGTTIIGGPGAGEGNIIAYSGCDGRFACGSQIRGSGISVFGTGNRIRGNSIFANAQLGIDLFSNSDPASRVTPNHDCGAAVGANNLQNYPVLTSVITNNNSTTIQGALNSRPSTFFTVDFYASPACNASGYGEGKTYLGFTSINTDAGCNASINLTLPIVLAAGQVVTSTASDPFGNTSEFSACIPVTVVTCNFTINPTSQNFSPSFGAGSVGVTAAGGCSWATTNTLPWVIITSGATGSGNGSVNYLVVANLGPARSGTMTIAGQTFTITQDSGCTFSINPISHNSPAGSVDPADTGSVDVTAATGCNWTTVNTIPWVTITSGASGVGNGTVSFSVARNTGPPRTGIMTIAGQKFTVSQEGFNTTPGPDVLVQPTDGIDVIFTNVSAPGNTAATPIIPPNPIIPALPPGFVFFKNLAFDISTTATVTGSITVSFDLSRLVPDGAPTPEVFAKLRVLHGENGVLVDRTIPPNPIIPPNPVLVGRVSSLSPFVIAQLINQPPVAKCKNIEVAAGSSCTASINPSDVDAGSFDPDSGDTIKLSLDQSGPFGLGPHTVTLTVTDNHGASNSCTATVTIKDNTPPTITAPPNVNASTGPGATNCGVVIGDATLGTATASDNCSAVTVLRSGVPAGNFFPVGTTTITYTATDASGNTSTATQTVTVVDNTPPKITCPSNIAVEFANETGAVVTFPLLAATDNCVVASVLCVPPSGSVFPMGTTTITCNATDPSTNTASCVFSVTVLGARGVKQNVLNEMIALRAGVTNKEDGDKLDEAIKHLTASLDAKLWIDQTHLQPIQGEKAFNEEKDTVNKLRDLIKEKKSAITDAVLQDLINRIVKSDRLLAFVAISDAVAAHGDQKEIDKARDELASGDSDIAGGKYEGGIEHYRNGWQHALKATDKS